jgi:hypothetical protein
MVKIVIVTNVLMPYELRAQVRAARERKERLLAGEAGAKEALATEKERCITMCMCVCVCERVGQGDMGCYTNAFVTIHSSRYAYHISLILAAPILLSQGIDIGRGLRDIEANSGAADHGDLCRAERVRRNTPIDTDIFTPPSVTL